MAPDSVPAIYLDWNATAPPLDESIAAMVAAARSEWANPASVHRFGRRARARVESAREAVASLARCDVRDVVFTSGGTEANNIALRSEFGHGDCVGEPGVLVTSRAEHASIVRVAEALEREGRARVRWVHVGREGAIDVEDLEQALSSGDVRLIAIQAVNQETGVIQPLEQVRAVADQAGARLHVDAVQAFGRARDVAEFADTRSMAAHKIRGPKSIGALVGGRCSMLAPVLLGGAQERGLRPGTVDPIAAAGFEVAARHAMDAPSIYDGLAALRDRLENALLDLAGDARVNGCGGLRMPHVTNISFRGYSGSELVAALDLEGVAVSSGSACSAGTAEPSPVLIAMSDRDTAVSSVRFSLGEDTTEDDIEEAVESARRVFARISSGCRLGA
jgi:cysteine desulfurase